MLAVLVALPAGARAADTADAALARARAALDGGRAALARQVVGAALQAADLQPVQRARLLLDRGLAQELEGAHDKALADFTAAIDARALPDPEQAQALLQRGFLLDSLGRLDGAVRDYSAVIALTPGAAATARNNRGNVYRRRNRLELARQDYLAALQGANSHPEYPYTGLGHIAEAEGDTAAARRYYAQAVAANAHYAPAVARLAALGDASAASGPVPPPAPATAPEAIHLRPPTGMAPGGTPTAPAAAPEVIHLRPPPGVTPTPEVIHLRPPKARTVGAPKAWTKVTQGAAPALRPAIDGGPAGQGLVQLGAWRSRAEAEDGWTRFRKRAGGILDGLSPAIVTADLPGRGRYYRLRVRPGPGGATALCRGLEARGLDCLIVSN